MSASATPTSSSTAPSTSSTVIPVDLSSAGRAHGTMMFIAFAVLMPLSIFTARYLRRSPHKGATPSPVFFPLHLFLNAVAACFFVSGFTMALFMSHTKGFNTAHKRLGLSIALILLVQVAGGVLVSTIHASRPHNPRDPVFVTWPHLIIGWCLLVLGLVNIPLGLYHPTETPMDKMVSSNAVKILYFVWLGILGVGFIAAEALYRIRRSR